MKNKKIYLASPQVSGKEMKYVKDCFKTNWLAPLGPYVDRFESDIKKYTGSKYAVAVNSGTSAIHLALKMLDLEEGSIVLVPDFTFIATVNPVMYEKLTPVFIDTDKNFSLDLEYLDEAFDKYGDKVKAVIVTHLYGQVGELESIKTMCKENNAYLIEDSCETLGTFYKGVHTGLYGDYGTFSFNGNKIVTTTGGGMLVSKKNDLKKAFHLATQARKPGKIYDHDMIGYNYRLSNVCASIGVGQLECIDKKIEKKKYIYDYYSKHLNNSLKVMPMRKTVKSNYWLTVAMLDEDVRITTDDIITMLSKNNIEARNVWFPIHLQDPLDEYDYIGNNYSTELFNRCICLPSDTNMTKKQQEKVVMLINNFMEDNR